MMKLQRTHEKNHCLSKSRVTIASIYLSTVLTMVLILFSLLTVNLRTSCHVKSLCIDIVQITTLLNTAVRW